MIVGYLCDHNLVKYEQPINNIVSQAQGEYVLEDMIRKNKEYWLEFELELFRYRKLIRGWDNMFNKLDEDFVSLTSMKVSPHYKSFKNDIAPWNEKLQKIRIVFDIWIDTQKKWVSSRAYSLDLEE